MMMTKTTPGIEIFIVDDGFKRMDEDPDIDGLINYHREDAVQKEQEMIQKILRREV